MHNAHSANSAAMRSDTWATTVDINRALIQWCWLVVSLEEPAYPILEQMLDTHVSNKNIISEIELDKRRQLSWSLSQLFIYYLVIQSWLRACMSHAGGDPWSSYAQLDDYNRSSCSTVQHGTTFCHGWQVSAESGWNGGLNRFIRMSDRNRFLLAETQPCILLIVSSGPEMTPLQETCGNSYAHRQADNDNDNGDG